VPTLHVLRGADKGRTFETPDEPAILGRLSEQIPLTDTSVSRKHAQLKPENGHWVLSDLGSSNGTLLNGVRIHEPARLKHGDQIKLGATLLVFSGEDAGEGFGGPQALQDMVQMDSDGGKMDSSILAAVSSSEDSLVLATPETADAVHAWTVMYQVAEIVAAGLSVSAFLERVADTLADHLFADRVLILMRDNPDADFKTQAIRLQAKNKEKAQGKQAKITASKTIIKHVAQTKQGVLCANAMADERFADRTKEGSIHRLGLRSVICVPIVAHDEVHGVIHLDTSMSHHTYTNEQLRLVTAIGRMTGLAIENARLIETRLAHERLAGVGETVAHLSHYIRNILQGIGGGADVLEMGIRNKNLEPVEEGWKIIQRNLDRTYQLTTNMLSFSKERQPAIELGQLNRAVEEAIAMVQRRADEREVMLLTELGEDLPALPLDLEGITQVVTNILNNALDAAHVGTGRVNVRTRYQIEAERVTLSIADNGPGIPADQIDHIFDAFHSTKGHSGTGLGLAAARKIIHELHGQIEVQSQPGEGTTFHIHLPVGTIRLKDSHKTQGPAK
ncbi:MAG: ATP-binding protein, partial [Phycisphaerae bacterium]